MNADEYVPSDARMREQYIWAHTREAGGVAEQSYGQVCSEVWDAWLAAHDARVKRDAALHEKQRIAGEVRLWASINHDLANEGMGDLLDLVAGDIDRIPEETP